MWWLFPLLTTTPLLSRSLWDFPSCSISSLVQLSLPRPLGAREDVPFSVAKLGSSDHPFDRFESGPLKSRRTQTLDITIVAGSGQERHHRRRATNKRSLAVISSGGYDDKVHQRGVPLIPASMSQIHLDKRKISPVLGSSYVTINLFILATRRRRSNPKTSFPCDVVFWD